MISFGCTILIVSPKILDCYFWGLSRNEIRHFELPTAGNWICTIDLIIFDCGLFWRFIYWQFSEFQVTYLKFDKNLLFNSWAFKIFFSELFQATMSSFRMFNESDFSRKSKNSYSLWTKIFELFVTCNFLKKILHILFFCQFSFHNFIVCLSQVFLIPFTIQFIQFINASTE